MAMKECPFCKSTSVTIGLDEDGFYVECNGCLARGPAELTQEEAEEAWNGRKDDGSEA